MSFAPKSTVEEAARMLTPYVSRTIISRLPECIVGETIRRLVE